MNSAIKERSWVEIDLDSYRHNLTELKRFFAPQQSFMQIVKADAYGHGAFEISKIASKEGACYLGVANCEEGKLLRIQGIKMPILVLSPSLTTEIEDLILHDLSVAISNFEFANDLNRYAYDHKTKVKIHIKIDTGMHRSGLDYESCLNDLNRICKLANLEIEGIFSHYASSESNTEFSEKQLGRFLKVINALPVPPKYVHVANSSALLGKYSGQETMNLVRLGILSYGVYTSPQQMLQIDLRPVMSFKSRIAHIKTLSKNEVLGYNLTYKASKDTVYAIIPVGYADGYDFLLGNRGKVCIKGKVLPVIGRISMDMITIELGMDHNFEIGDEVTLLGNCHPETRVEQLTAKYQGSAYELLCQIGRRAKRFYISEGSIVASSPLSRRDFVSSDFTDSKLNLIIESAISQRLQSNEIGELIYREILRSFFYNKDKDIHYRKNFVHSLKFTDVHLHEQHHCDPKTKFYEHYFRTNTELTFEKVLQNDYFIVACANSDKVLNRYFQRKDVEYRWLMDSNFSLTDEQFTITGVSVDGIDLNSVINRKQGCLEIRCSHPLLKDLMGKQVKFSISTQTFYPKTSHQLSVFITELTQGIRISLIHPDSLESIEVIPIFSGQNKYPKISRTTNKISIATQADEWIFPMSGIVFAY